MQLTSPVAWRQLAAQGAGRHIHVGRDGLDRLDLHLRTVREVFAQRAEALDQGGLEIKGELAHGIRPHDVLPSVAICAPAKKKTLAAWTTARRKNPPSLAATSAEEATSRRRKGTAPTAKAAPESAGTRAETGKARMDQADSWVSSAMGGQGCSASISSGQMSPQSVGRRVRRSIDKNAASLGQ